MPSLKDATENRSAKAGRGGHSNKSSAKADTPKWTHREMDAMPSQQIWEHYQNNGRPTEIRNYFWQKYSHLVRYIADRTYARLPNEVDVGDLISAGQFGLMDAIDLFDLSRGVKIGRAHV